jgi:hypothetical protein
MLHVNETTNETTNEIEQALKAKQEKELIRILNLIANIAIKTYYDGEYEPTDE